MLFAALLCMVFLASGCAATKTFLQKGKLRTETKMSETIFLEPTTPEQKIVYVDIRNTTGQDMPGIEGDIVDRIAGNGFRITEDPDEATFILQGNILQFKRSDLDEANSLLGEGFEGVEGVLEGATIGGVIGRVIAGDDEANKGTIIGSLAGGVTGFLFATSVTDVLYTMVTDIEIRERIPREELLWGLLNQTPDAEVSQGSDTKIKQKLDGMWNVYRTRVVSIANKRNLEVEEAKPHLRTGLVRSIGGIF